MTALGTPLADAGAFYYFLMRPIFINMVEELIMAKSKGPSEVHVVVKINAPTPVAPEKMKPLEEALESAAVFSMVFRIKGGSNQFIVRAEDYQGEVTAKLGSNDAIFSFDCIVRHKIDRWMKKYQEEAPFDCFIEGVYDVNGDLHRLGDPDEDGWRPGVLIGKVSMDL